MRSFHIFILFSSQVRSVLFVLVMEVTTVYPRCAAIYKTSAAELVFAITRRNLITH